MSKKNRSKIKSSDRFYLEKNEKTPRRFRQKKNKHNIRRTERQHEETERQQIAITPGEAYPMVSERPSAAGVVVETFSGGVSSEDAIRDRTGSAQA